MRQVVICGIALIGLALGACEKRGNGAQSITYKEWRKRNETVMQAQSGALTKTARLYVDVYRDCRKIGDWVEVAINGVNLGRYVQEEMLPSDELVMTVILYRIELTDGPNVISVFSGRTNSGCDVDPSGVNGAELRLSPIGENNWILEPYKDPVRS
jgi:hypothetical protein